VNAWQTPYPTNFIYFLSLYNLNYTHCSRLYWMNLNTLHHSKNNYITWNHFDNKTVHWASSHLPSKNMEIKIVQIYFYYFFWPVFKNFLYPVYRT
jgi:hypothetical protein